MVKRLLDARSGSRIVRRDIRPPDQSATSESILRRRDHPLFTSRQIQIVWRWSRCWQIKARIRIC